MKEGIYENIHFDDYRKIDAISNSYLKRLAMCPASAKVPGEDTPALIFGRALHLFVLEGQEKFQSEFTLMPAFDKRTKAGKEAFMEWSAAHANQQAITEEQYNDIQEMDKAVKKHPLASKLLSQGISEQTVIWKDPLTGLMCKCRPDRIPDGGKTTQVDLKSCVDASPEGFLRAVVKFGYHQQNAFYQDGTSLVTGQLHDSFAFIAVEKSEPYRCEVYTLSPDFIEAGRLQYQRLLRLEQSCRHKNEWNNYTNPEATELYLPPWVRAEAFQD